MDALSIAASAAGVAALVGTLINSVTVFVVDFKNADQSIEDFKNTLLSLQSVLKSVETTFTNKELEQYDFERQHWEDIRRILNACNHCVYQLYNGLPNTSRNNSVVQRVSSQLISYAKSNLVASIQGRISSYTQCLQVSISAIGIVLQWRSHESQTQIRDEIQKLRAEIQKAMRVPQRRNLPVTPDSSEEDLADKSMLDDFAASQNMERWYSSAEAVAFSISKFQPDQVSIAERPAEAALRHRSSADRSSSGNGPNMLTERSNSYGIASDGPLRDEDSDMESLLGLEVDLPGALPLNMMTHQIEVYQRFVQDMMSGQFYGTAEEYQRNVIRLLEQREQVYGLNFDSRGDQEEVLANILRGRGSPRSLSGAKDILHRLLKTLKNGDSIGKRSGVLHSLALVYEAQGEPRRSLRCAQQALVEREQAEAEIELIEESLRLLLRLYRQLGEPPSVVVIQKKLRDIENNSQSESLVAKRSSSEAEDNRISETNVYQWLQENEFDRIEPENTNKTPLQLAISRVEIEIVQGLLEAGASLEKKDSAGRSPLLLAACTRSKTLVNIMLEDEADITCTDDSGNSALHCVQSTEGGVQVALLLLSQAPPIDINEQNDLGQTPLHRAVQFGNAAMVETLLAAPANPNLQDKSGSTPLHVALEFRREDIVRLLLRAGADINIKDSSGQDPVAAAQCASPALPEAKIMLERARKGRQGSMASVASVGSPSLRRFSTWGSRGPSGPALSQRGSI